MLIDALLIIPALHTIKKNSDKSYYGMLKLTKLSKYQ